MNTSPLECIEVEDRADARIPRANRATGTDRARRDLDDAELLDLARLGDHAAFGVLVERHRRAATGFARSLYRPGVGADDLVAEALAKTYRALRHGFGPREAFRPYLFTAVRRVASKVASSSRSTPIGLPADLPARPEPTPAFESDARILRALDDLPPRWRSVLWLLEVEGFSTAEVAGSLGLSNNAVAALAYRARAGLRAGYLQRVGPEAGAPAPASR